MIETRERNENVEIKEKIRKRKENRFLLKRIKKSWKIRNNRNKTRRPHWVRKQYVKWKNE